MADPVDTDALRHLLVTGAPPLSAPAAGHDKWIGQVRIAGVTAADEVDRLRRELRWMSDHATQRAAAYEHLRSVIEDAPHEDRCPSAQNEPGVHLTDECTCWKAKAL